jgi:hypothetical protein
MYEYENRRGTTVEVFFDVTVGPYTKNTILVHDKFNCIAVIAKGNKCTE